MRAVTGEQVQASPSSSAGPNNQQQQSQQNSQSSPPQQRAQYRVSQIMCHFGSPDVSNDEPLVFNLRQDPISPPSMGSVRVVQQFFIGDNAKNEQFDGSVSQSCDY